MTSAPTFWQRNLPRLILVVLIFQGVVAWKLTQQGNPRLAELEQCKAAAKARGADAGQACRAIARSIAP